MNETLAALGDEYWERYLADNPMFASILGDHRYDDRMGDFSAEAEDRRIAHLRSIADRAEAIDPDELDPADRVSLEVLHFSALGEIDVLESRLSDFTVNPASGIQAILPTALAQLPIETAEHAVALLERYRDLGHQLGVAADRLADAADRSRTSPSVHVDAVIAQLDAHLATDLDDDPYLRVRNPMSFSDDEMLAWRAELATVVADHVRPGFARLREVLADRVRPVARSADQPGLGHLPGGEAAYAGLLAYHTSTDLSAEDIHRIGLEQVSRLADEYRSLGGEVLGTTDLAEIFERLRDDPALHFETGEEVRAAAETAMARAKAAMGDWFGRLPQADCLVGEVPSGPVAFYYPPAEDGSRPGTFFVNTADPTSWARYEIQATAFHEGIPGHHLQLAISQELEDVPAFQRHARITAYAEGWGLYTERLADEMGLYSSQLDRIGMLSADSMRACRLVVDTGLHAMGWTRQQAIDYVVANSPMRLGTIVPEIDRYIGMPGQATAYMVGRLEIQRIRTDAEQRLGDAFDIKAFHDVVLGSGLVPLGTLERMVDDWVVDAA
ncbi:MAG: DUF885 domain-containing protein [Acidimicrobiia bacterium]